MTFIKMTCEVSVDLSEIPDEDIADELKRRKVEHVGHSIRRIYEAIADGRTRDALEEMHAAFDDEGLAPPSTQLALADLISGRKASSHVRN